MSVDTDVVFREVEKVGEKEKFGEWRGDVGVEDEVEKEREI